MFANERDVQLKSFKVIEADFEYIDSDSETEVFLDFDVYDINVEYQTRQVEEDTLALTMSIAVNGDDEPELGYRMYVLGVMIFEVLDWEVNEDYQANVKEAVQLGIGNIRGYLMNITAFGIMGPYILPNIEIDEFDDDDTNSDEGVRNLNPDRR